MRNQDFINSQCTVWTLVDGVLKECDIDNAVITSTHQEYYDSNNNLLFTTEDCKNTKFYRSKEDFENSQPIPRDSPLFRQLYGVGDLFEPVMDIYYKLQVIDGDCKIAVWTPSDYENPKILSDGFHIRINWSYHKYSVYFDDSNIYPSLQEMIAWEGYSYTTKDGVEQKKRAWKKEMLFDAKQNLAYSKLIDALEECKAANLCFIHDTDHSTLYAYSDKLRMLVSYDGDEGFDIPIRDVENVLKYVDIITDGCFCDLSVKFDNLQED